MKNIAFSIRMSLRRAFGSTRFLAAVVLTYLLYMLDLLPMFLSGIHNVDGVRYYSYSILALSDFSGMTFFLGFTFITAVLPFAGVLCDDLHSRFLTPYVRKNSGAGYVTGAVTACMVSSFVCVVLALIMCFCTFRIFVPVTDENFEQQKMNYVYPLVQGGHVMLYLTVRAALWGLRGAFFALVSLLMSTVIKSKYVIYAVPYILYFFLMRFGYGVLDVDPMFNVLGVYFDFALGYDRELLSLLYTFGFTVVVGVITGFALTVKIRRSV